jgi:hypothetical protein
MTQMFAFGYIKASPTHNSSHFHPPRWQSHTGVHVRLTYAQQQPNKRLSFNLSFSTVGPPSIIGIDVPFKCQPQPTTRNYREWHLLEEKDDAPRSSRPSSCTTRVYKARNACCLSSWRVEGVVSRCSTSGPDTSSSCQLSRALSTFEHLPRCLKIAM